MKNILIIIMLITGVGANAQYFEYNLKAVLERENSSALILENFDKGVLELTYDGVTITPATGNKMEVAYDEFKKASFSDVYNPAYASIEAVKAQTMTAYILPKSDNLVIESNRTIGNITIYSITGQVLINTVAKGNPAIVDVSFLPKGFYILKTGGQTLKLYRG